jgi:hypothetical protein
MRNINKYKFIKKEGISQENNINKHDNTLQNQSNPIHNIRICFIN